MKGKGKEKEKARSAPAELRRRLARLARELGRAECLLQGTICPRRISRHGAAGEKRYGPYYQWTFKDAGTTVTVNLSAAQWRDYQRAIRRQRQIERIIGEMRVLSRAYLEKTTSGVVKRNRKK